MIFSIIARPHLLLGLDENQIERAMRAAGSVERKHAPKLALSMLERKSVAISSPRSHKKRLSIRRVIFYYSRPGSGSAMQRKAMQVAGSWSEWSRAEIYFEHGSSGYNERSEFYPVPGATSYQ
jgi:hypothetical protein